MEQTNKKLIEEFKWENAELGTFTVTLENNKVEKLNFCEVGNDQSRCLHCCDETYLRAVNKALTDLFRHIDREPVFARASEIKVLNETQYLQAVIPQD